MIDGLQVRSQTSSFYFKGQRRDLREVDRQLNVDFVVEATVQRAGNRIRINAQLVRTSDGGVLWNEPFDRTLDDVLAIQDEISRAIVNKLRLTLGRGQRRYQLSPAATDLYLRARAAVSRRGTQSAREAAQLFTQVIAMAPDYAPAHAGLAEAYAEMTWQLDGMSLNDGLAVMRPAAERAIELDPLLPEALAAMGTTHAYERQWDDAKKSYERALELSTTTLSGIRAGYAIRVMLPLGEFARAEELLASALVFDPLSLPVRRDLGIALYAAGRYEDAIANLRQVVDADLPFGAIQMLARALTQAGRPAEALAVFASRPENKAWERWMMPAYVKEGRDQDVKRLFDADAHRTDTPHRQAIIYAGLGNKDLAFEALGRAADVMPHRIAFIIACPDMELLRGDPRLDLLKKRLNLR
jgi:tetratricopeptide (TPR) repeat protein